MFFTRDKTSKEPPVRTGLTDGVEAQVAEFVKEWGALQRGERKPVRDSKEAPLQLLTDADVAYFVQAMEAEVARIEDEIDTLKRERLADIARKDAQIAAANREIESRKAALNFQDAEIQRRATARVILLEDVNRIAPKLDIGKLNDDAVRREVVRYKFGDAAITAQNQAYIDSRFDFLVDESKVDPFRRVVADGIRPSSNDGKAAADRAYDEMVADLTKSYRETHH